MGLFHFTVQGSQCRNSSWNLEAGTGAEAMKDAAYLFVPWIVHSACFLITPRTTSPGIIPSRVSWAPHPLGKCTTGQSDGGIFSIEVSFPKITVVCVKLT